MRNPKQKVDYEDLRTVVQLLRQQARQELKCLADSDDIADLIRKANDASWKGFFGDD